MAPSKRIALVGFVAFLFAVVFLGIFPPNTPRIFLNQRRAVGSLGELNRAEFSYKAWHPNSEFACDLAGLAGPQIGAASVDPVLASGTKSSYHFEIHCAQVGNKASADYAITATPVKPGATGQYALCTDQSGKIWYSENGLAADCLATHKPIERKYRQ
jgi:hypothetical protein